ncbi:hypothetical protein BGZ76_010824 [Entomortierella beljakovae]|nr:hypothetical protein BGZ76_010824 [Entomortierella beljakovae]
MLKKFDPLSSVVSCGYAIAATIEQIFGPHAQVTIHIDGLRTMEKARSYSDREDRRTKATEILQKLIKEMEDKSQQGKWVSRSKMEAIKKNLRQVFIFDTNDKRMLGSQFIGKLQVCYCYTEADLCIAKKCETTLHRSSSSESMIGGSEDDGNEDGDDEDDDLVELENILEGSDDSWMEVNEAFFEEIDEEDSGEIISSARSSTSATSLRSKINWKQESRLLGNVEVKHNTPAQCPDPSNTTIIGIDPGEIYSMTIAKLNPNDSNEREILRASRKYLYKPLKKVRHWLEERKLRLGVTSFENNIPSFSRSSMV